MIKIDEYIEQAKQMENVSDGGSPAYSFGDYVLVKYSMLSQYGLARDNEELIAEEANKKNRARVKTPLHVAIKRTDDGIENVCWVLQEKAKGVSFVNYAYLKNDPQTQLRLQQELLEAPDYHYEKCLQDIAELFHMGLELKPKNIFYDNSRNNGGFTFIDLLNYDPTPMNPDLIADVLMLDKYVQAIFNSTYIGFYDKKASESEKKESLEMHYEIRKKVFIAMEKVIPNFSQYKRWILRSYSSDLLQFLSEKGILVEDLSLNENEYKEFDNYIEIIINHCIEQISRGKSLFWQIEANEIRIMLDNMGLFNSWKYHNFNPVQNLEDYEDEWEFNYASKKSLEEVVNKLFDERLCKVAENSNNEFILQAKRDLDERNGKRTQ